MENDDEFGFKSLAQSFAPEVKKERDLAGTTRIQTDQWWRRWSHQMVELGLYAVDPI